MRAHLFSGLFLALAACDSSPALRVVGTVSERIVPKGPLAAVRIASGVGGIVVRPAAGADVVVTAEVKLSVARPDGDFVPRLRDHVRVTETGADLTLESAHAGAADARDWQLVLTVDLPADLRLDLHTPTGSIDVGLGAAAALRAEVGTGSVRVAVGEVRGTMEVLVGTGEAEVTVSRRGPSEGGRFECGTGRLQITLPPDVHGVFGMQVETGDLTVDPRFGLQPERNVTRVECAGRVGDGGPAFSLRVGTGQVVLR